MRNLKPGTTEFILVRGDWFLAKDGRSATNRIEKAKRYKTWKGAQKRAENTSWKYTSIEDIEDYESEEN